MSSSGTVLPITSVESSPNSIPPCLPSRILKKLPLSQQIVPETSDLESNPDGGSPKHVWVKYHLYNLANPLDSRICFYHDWKWWLKKKHQTIPQAVITQPAWTQDVLKFKSVCCQTSRTVLVFEFLRHFLNFQFHLNFTGNCSCQSFFDHKRFRSDIVHSLIQGLGTEILFTLEEFYIAPS